MSTSVFPSLPGLAFPVKRASRFRSNIQETGSGAETAISYWTTPRWRWELKYNFLRQGTLNLVSYTEYTSLQGFFNQRYGRWDTWLYTDADDNSVTDQAIGTGNGSTTVFQLVRTYAGFTENVLAPNVITNVKLNGVTQSGGSYSVSSWGSATPGRITFNTPPGNGVAITATYTYYWPCRFEEDEMSFDKFMDKLFSQDGVIFSSVKN